MTEPSTQPVAALSAFARARAALTALRDRAAAWWAEANRKWPVAGILSVAVLLIGTGLLYTCSDTPDLAQRPTAEQPAAVQTNPLAPLVDRLDALDDQVAKLKDQVDGLQRRQPPQASASGRIATPRPASSQSTQTSTAPERRRWGTTDLDREIDAFTQSLDNPTPLEPTK